MLHPSAGTLYAIGGQAASVTHQTVERYTASQGWTQAPSLIVGRSGHVYGNFDIILGRFLRVSQLHATLRFNCRLTLIVA